VTDVTIDSDDSNIAAVNFTNQSADPTAPGSGHTLLFVKNGIVYVRTSDGTVTPVGGAIALTDGSILVGDASDLASELAIGAEGQVLTVQGDATLAWDTPTTGSGGGLTLISQHVVPAGGEASYTFSDIPQTHRNLVLDLTLRNDKAAANWDTPWIRFNADTGSNYNYEYRFTYSGTGSTGGAAQGQAQALFGYCVSALSPSGHWPTVRVVVPLYANTSILKGFYARGTLHFGSGATSIGQQNSGGFWNSSAAITSLTVGNLSTPIFLEGSILRLMGES
jgi:hypothetical protein